MQQIYPQLLDTSLFVWFFKGPEVLGRIWGSLVGYKVLCYNLDWDTNDRFFFFCSSFALLLKISSSQECFYLIPRDVFQAQINELWGKENSNITDAHTTVHLLNWLSLFCICMPMVHKSKTVWQYRTLFCFVSVVFVFNVQSTLIWFWNPRLIKGCFAYRSLIYSRIFLKTIKKGIMILHIDQLETPEKEMMRFLLFLWKKGRLRNLNLQQDIAVYLCKALVPKNVSNYPPLWALKKIISANKCRYLLKKKAVSIHFPEMKYHLLKRMEMINIVSLFRKTISQDKSLVNLITGISVLFCLWFLPVCKITAVLSCSCCYTQLVILS